MCFFRARALLSPSVPCANKACGLATVAHGRRAWRVGAKLRGRETLTLLPSQKQGTELRLELHDGKQVTVEVRERRARGMVRGGWMMITPRAASPHPSPFPPTPHQLVDGRAELFGAELHTGEPLTRTGPPFAVFTWTGATLHVGAADGTPLSTAAALVYVADETPAAAYVNVHDGLEARRQVAAAAGEEGVAAAAAADSAPDAAAATTRSPHDGPRAIVVGPVDAGKSTLVRTLANYAVRAGWAPLLIDLDVGQGSLSPPGTIAAAPVDAPLCAGAPPGAAAGVDAPDAPLVFWYGAPSPGDNPDLFRFVVDRLAGLLARRAASSARAARAAGWLVNWMGWVDDAGYDLLRHAIDALGVDVVLVVGHDRLFARLQAELR